MLSPAPCFLLPLAYADAHDDPNAMLALVLICCGLLVVVALLAMVPLVIARRRRSRFAEGIKLGCVLWALFAAGFVLYAVFSHYRATSEYTHLVASGYYDPENPAAQPHWPWPVAGALACAYLPLIALSLGSKASPAARADRSHRGSPPPPGSSTSPPGSPPPGFHRNN